MKKALFFSLLLLASAPVLAVEAPATDVVQGECKCGEGCDCMKTHDACPCDKTARNDDAGCGGVCTKAGDKDDKDGGCGGACGRSVQVCEADCKDGGCAKADTEAA